MPCLLAAGLLDTLLFGLAVLGGLVVAAHLLLPIAGKFMVWIGTSPRIEEIPIDARDLEPAAAAHMAERGAELEAQGFEFGALVRVSEYAPSETMYMTFYAHRPTGTQGAAIAKATRFAGQDGKETTRWKLYTELDTEYPDTRRITTNNLRTPPNTCDMFTVIHAPQVSDTRSLIALHAAAVRRFGGSARPRPIEHEGWWIGALERSLHAVVESEVRAGTLYHAGDGKARLTWMGAYLRMWQVLWPWGLIRHARARAVTRELMAEAGV